MALVDYGSDSDDEPTPVASAPAPAAPPPKKRAKGPVRILLDLPKPAASEAPPAKKPRFALGGSVSGLAALLPPPKHESVAVKLEQALADVPSKTVAVAGASGAHVAVNAASVGFVPHRVAKSKKPAPVPLPEVDFFGLGTSEMETRSAQADVLQAKRNRLLRRRPSPSSSRPCRFPPPPLSSRLPSALLPPPRTRTPALCRTQRVLGSPRTRRRTTSTSHPSPRRPRLCSPRGSTRVR